MYIFHLTLLFHFQFHNLEENKLVQMHPSNNVFDTSINEYENKLVVIFIH